MKNLYSTALLIAGALCAGSLFAQSKTQPGQHRMLTAVPGASGHVITSARGTAPVNDACGSVTPQSLSVGGSLTFTGNNTGATIDGDYEAGSILEGAGFPSVWHAFTTTTCADVVLSYCNSDAGFSSNYWIVITTACPAGDASIVFNSSNEQTTCPDGMGTITYTNLPAGTYYVPVLTDEANGVNGNYTIAVTATACIAPPANDDCSGAAVLTADTWCNAVTFGATSATESLAGIDCNGFTGDANDDIWFSFVATATDMTFGAIGTDDGDGDNSTGYDAVIEVFDGCGGTSLGCADATLSCEAEEVALTGLTVGNTYYARVYHWFTATPSPNSVAVCVVEGGSINIGMEEKVVSEWLLFPNPNEGQFSLTYLGASGNANIEARDVTGRIVFRTVQRVNTNTQVQVDLGDVLPGNYFVNLDVNGFTTNVRVAVK